MSFFKIRKNSYTGLLFIANPQYGDHHQEILSFSLFLPQTGDFRYNRRLTPTDFEKKFEIFKTSKTHIWDSYL
jgi:hypothetical protein